MALPTFPAGVNYKPDLNAYRVLELHRPVIWTEFEDGPALGRRSGSRRAKLAYRLVFTRQSEAYAFRTFVETTLVDGTLRFTMPVWREDSQSYVTRTVQIDRGEVVIDTFGLGFAASFTLIVYDW